MIPFPCLANTDPIRKILGSRFDAILDPHTLSPEHQDEHGDESGVKVKLFRLLQETGDRIVGKFLKEISEYVLLCRTGG